MTVLGTGFRDLFELRPSPPRLGPATRTAISAAIPILIGVAVGDAGAGLIATLGAFTARFGGDRPYLNRALQLAIIAVSLAGAVALGAWAAPVAWLAVVTVTAVALLAVWLCAALAVGPPGAYIFVLVCAAGVGVSGSHLQPGHIGALVLAGAAISWVVQMLPALVDVRRPEKAAVAAAGDAVAAYLDAPEADQTRRAAAEALHRAWTVLVTYQPRATRLNGLRHRNHALHVLFTDGMRAVASGSPTAGAQTARDIGSLKMSPETVVSRDTTRAALRPPGVATRLADALRPGSQTLWVLRRVALAVPVAGVAAAGLGLGHIYWAMAAAVLVLHLGTDRAATLQRGAARLLGTLAGLGLAAAVLAVHPQGLWLALVIPTLQFLIELLVVRNYLLATVFITAAALTISTANHDVATGPLLLDRGVDTVIGCVIGVVVYLLSAGRQEADRLGAALAGALDCAATATAKLGAPEGRRARRDLQLSIIALGTAYDAALAGPRRHRDTAARLARAVASAEHLGYLTIAAGWAAEHGRDDPLTDGDTAGYVAVLRELATAVRGGAAPAMVGDVPAVVRADVAAVADTVT
jgi:uncharacterized membrane protein YccC